MKWQARFVRMVRNAHRCITAVLVTCSGCLAIASFLLCKPVLAQDKGFRLAQDANCHDEQACFGVCRHPTSHAAGYNPDFYGECGAFSNADLRKGFGPRGSYRGLKILRSDFRGIDLSDSELTSSSVLESDFSQATLARVIAPIASLRGSKFNGANLTSSNLSKANLAFCDFSGADLRGADLSSANINQALFTGAIVSEKTRLPVPVQELVLRGAKIERTLGDSIDPHFADGKGTLIERVRQTAWGVRMIADPGKGFFIYGSVRKPDYYVQPRQTDDTVAGFVMKFSINGILDTAFGSAGVTFITGGGEVNLLDGTTTRDGGLFLVGCVGSTSIMNGLVIHLKADGTLDKSFGGGGRILSRPLPDTERTWYSTVVESVDGGVTALGSSWGTSTNPLGVYYLRKWTPAGTPDEAFGTHGETLFSDLRGRSSRDLSGYAVYNAMKRGLEGDIYVGGGVCRAVECATHAQPRIIRFTSAGVSDSRFGNGGIAEPDFGEDEMINDLSITDQGIYAITTRVTGGPDHTLTKPVTSFKARLLKMTLDGVLDTSFGVAGVSDVPETPNHIPFIGSPRRLQITSSRLLVSGQGFFNKDFSNTASSSWLQAPNSVVTLGFTLSGKPDATFGYGGILFQDPDAPLEFADVFAPDDSSVIWSTPVKGDASAIAIFRLESEPL